MLNCWTCSFIISVTYSAEDVIGNLIQLVMSAVRIILSTVDW